MTVIGSSLLRLDRESTREARWTIPAFSILFILPLLLPLLVLIWLWGRIEALPAAASPGWGQWVGLWWLSAVVFSLLPLASLAANYFCYELLGMPLAMHRQATQRSLKSAMRIVREQLQEGEQPLSAMRMRLPAPFHPLRSALWEGTAEPPSHLGILAATVYGSLFPALIGGFLGVPLGKHWQGTLIALWLACSLLPLMTGSGGLSLVMHGGLALFAAFFGIMCLTSGLLEPTTSSLGLALLGVAVLNGVMLLIRLLPCLHSPVNGLLIATDRQVLVLGRRIRRWQIISALASDSSVRVTLTARAIDALVCWEVGWRSFTATANLCETMELRTLLTERFPRWQWNGDAITSLPPWWERLKRDGVWRLALLLAFCCWVGCVWHLSILRFEVTQKLCWPQEVTEAAEKYLARAELAVRLLPEEPFVLATRANALFAAGEWELMQQQLHRLPSSDYWRLHRKMLAMEAKWRAGMAPRSMPDSWQASAQMAASHLDRMLRRRRFWSVSVNRSRYHLRKAATMGAPESLRDAEDLLRRSEVREDLALVREARQKLRAVL